jgi:hypothetical protein
MMVLLGFLAWLCFAWPRSVGKKSIQSRGAEKHLPFPDPEIPAQYVTLSGGAYRFSHVGAFKKISVTLSFYP